MNADKLPEEDSKVINLDKSGNIVFNSIPVSKDELMKDLEALYMRNRKASILIRADGARPYKEVIALMKTVKESGFSDVQLVTQADAE
jgi:biopolymer transport protein TolR